MSKAPSPSGYRLYNGEMGEVMAHMTIKLLEAEAASGWWADPEGDIDRIVEAA